MDRYELSAGEGRTSVSLLAYHLGIDLVVTIYNETAHVGAVAVGEWDEKEHRASCSVITRPGHKDDAIAGDAAHTLSKYTRRPVCVLAGIHLDNISRDEISAIIKNSEELVSRLCGIL